jgi:hypothetical protein
MEQTHAQGPAGSPETLEQEVEHLAAAVRRAEGRIRALQWWLGFVVLLALAGAAAGVYRARSIPIEGYAPPMARRVEAKEFGFYNRFGTRVVLEADDKWGLPQLIFMDLKKEYRLGIKVWPEGDGTPGMVFYDKSGMRGNFRMEEDGSAVINLVGQNQKGASPWRSPPTGRRS